MAQTLTDGFPMYNCYGVIFYSENVLATALLSKRTANGAMKGYPQIYVGTNLGGTAPHTIFPISNDTLFDSSSSQPFYFLIVDSKGLQVGMAYLGLDGYIQC